MLSSAIKTDAFLLYKKSCFYNMKSLEKRKVLYFALGYCYKNVLYRHFTQNISRIVTDHVKVYA